MVVISVKHALAILGLSICGASYAERIDLRLAGQQGDHYFFTVPKTHILDEAFLLKTAEGFCSSKIHCYVHFWEAGKAAPKAFPLSAQEAGTEVASYMSNKRTGKKEMLWRCTLFPKASKGKCFS